MDPTVKDHRVNEYLLRLNRCIDYIQKHYADSLNLSKLAEVACFSRFHFHRLFRALIGETVNDFVQRVRLEKATQRLILYKDQPITDIALSCGFSSSQNFARCFKSYFGVTPSHVRAEYNWSTWAASLNLMKEENGAQRHPEQAERLRNYLRQHNIAADDLISSSTPMPVTIQQLPALRVAYVRTRGPYQVEAIRSAFDSVLRWARPKGLLDGNPIVLGVLWSTPSITPREKLIYDAGIAMPDTIKADKWVNIQTLKGGRFAVCHCEVEDRRHEEAWMQLILNWLVASDYQPDDRPGYEIYYSDSTSNDQRRTLLDLCLPIKPLKG
ncbi:MAG: GyrI-like domain-containing protein [Desulfobacteraceae bacterium]|nr:GyrI-like domain-containing protein [Desulfobacteraceae bacterium]